MTGPARSNRDRFGRIARIDTLYAMPARTCDQQAELDRLIAWRDSVWKHLPRSIENARRRLADLQRFAEATGLGRC